MDKPIKIFAIGLIIIYFIPYIAFLVILKAKHTLYFWICLILNNVLPIIVLTNLKDFGQYKGSPIWVHNISYITGFAMFLWAMDICIANGNQLWVVFGLINFIYHLVLYMFVCFAVIDAIEIRRTEDFNRMFQTLTSQTSSNNQSNSNNQINGV